MLSFTVSIPVKANLSMLGTIRMVYSVGTTSFGNFPGVSLKLNGFSADMMAGKVMDNTAARKGNRGRISRIKTMDITIRVNTWQVAVRPVVAPYLYCTTKTRSNCPPH